MESLSSTFIRGNKQEVVLFTSAGSTSSFALLLVLLGAATPAPLRQNLLLHHVNDLIWDSQVLDRASSDVALRHPPELVSILWGKISVDNLVTED